MKKHFLFQIAHQKLCNPKTHVATVSAASVWQPGLEFLENISVVSGKYLSDFLARHSVQTSDLSEN